VKELVKTDWLRWLVLIIVILLIGFCGRHG